MFLGGRPAGPGVRSSHLRALVSGLLVLVLVVPVVPAAAQGTPGLDETRERAARATQDLADAEARLGQLDGEISAAEHRAGGLRAEVAAMEGQLSEAAVARFVLSSQTPSMFTTDDLTRHLRGLRLGRIATEGSGDTLERYGVLWEDLQVAEAALAERRAEADQALEELAASRDQLLDDLARLEELERERLAELERQRIAEERRRAEEALRRAAEAEAQRRATAAAAAPSGGSATGGAAPGTAASPATDGAPAPPAAGPTGAPPRPAAPAAAPTAPPPAPGQPPSPPAAAAPPSTPPAPPTTAGPPPTSAVPPRRASGGRLALCPVDGPHTFVDTWGAPRSGGRRHQGVDIMARTGVPVVAPVAGQVTHRGNRVGGRSFHLLAEDGTTYYGTHLSGYGASGRVEAGTVIGYVGDDGNARGTPHLHFEVRPRGGAVNPYPFVAAVCSGAR